MSLLDGRLTAVANMVPACRCVADIGSDHGRMGAYLLKNNRCERVVFTDLSAPSLQKARALINRFALVGRAAFCVGDGAQALNEPVDACVIAGMGGVTIADIVTRGRDKLNGAALIMQPNVAITHLRQALSQSGYEIADETIARVAGWWYIIIKAVPGRAVYDERALTAGPVLIKKRHPLLPEYAAYRARIAEKALIGARAGGSMNAAALESELAIWKEILNGK